MWTKSLETLNPYEALRREIIENNDEELSFWDKIYRVSYTHNAFGIYQETYLFNKKIHTVLICRYIYE